MKNLLVGVLSLFLLSSCSGGATDVGNPTAGNAQTDFPEIGDLVGSFEVVEEVSVDSVGGIAETTTKCQSDSTASKSITTGDEEGTIILENVFNYSGSTQEIVADYDKSSGALTFSIVDNSTDISCEGEVSSVTTVPLAITFTCDVNVPVVENCSLQLEQIN